MGTSSSNVKITKFTKIQATIAQSNIIEFDKIFLLLDDNLIQAESIRSRVVNSREMLMRITKVHKFHNPSLIQAFKIWCWCVGACNEGQMKQVKFHIDDNILTGAQEQFESIMDIKSNPDGPAIPIIQFGNKGLSKLIYLQQQNVVNETVVKADVGDCADFRLECWPQVLSEYLLSLRSAKDNYTSILQRINYLIDKLSQFKTNKEVLHEMIHHMDASGQKSGQAKVTANISEYLFAKQVAEQFLTKIHLHLEEAGQFLSIWHNIYQDAQEIALKVFKDHGTIPYHKDPKQQLLDCKITKVAELFLKDLEPRSNEEKDEDNNFKIERQNRKPKTQPFDKDDLLSPRDQYPYKYRWVGETYLDTQFSAQYIDLSELEQARRQGEQARKAMFKMTGVGQWVEKTVASAFEVWTWQLASQCDGDLKKLDIRLDQNKPWLRGKDILVANQNPQSKEFVEQLTKWLDYYSPAKYKRLQYYKTEFLERREIVLSKKHQIFELLSQHLSPPDQYNAFTQYCKNLRLNEIYMERVLTLFDVITQYNGEMGLHLYVKAEALMIWADQIGPKVGGLMMNQMAIKHVPEKLADETTRQQRKDERMKAKSRISRLQS